MSDPQMNLGGDSSSFTGIARLATRGGRLATTVSAFAFAFSGVSFYETVLKQPQLSVFVPAVIHYARDDGGDVELFAVPITVVNDGAQSSTILGIGLEVENAKAGAEPPRKRYYAAYFGAHPAKSDEPGRAFAPASVPGRGTFSETLRFYPAGNPLPKLVQDAGDYRFTLTLDFAQRGAAMAGWIDWLLRTPPPAPLHFQMTLPWLSDEQVGFRRLAIAMHAPDFRPTATPGKGTASP